MILKLLGSVLVIASCGGFGFSIAASHKREVRLLHCLLETINYMRNELQYRCPVLPKLCRDSVRFAEKPIKEYFESLATELESQTVADTKSCCLKALSQTVNMPQSVKSIIISISDTMGLFDLDGQLDGLCYASALVNNALEKLTTDQDRRLRSYQTLALCGGAALAILLV